MVRPLRSTGITPLHRYYEPVRLPHTRADVVMFSHVRLGHMPSRRGSLRFLFLLSMYAVILYPRGPGVSTGAACYLFPPTTDPCHLWKVGRTPIALRGLQCLRMFALTTATSSPSGSLHPSHRSNQRTGTGHASPLRVTSKRLAAATCRASNLHGGLLSSRKKKQT